MGETFDLCVKKKDMKLSGYIFFLQKLKNTSFMLKALFHTCAALFSNDL